MKFIMQKDFELIANYLGRIMRVLGVVFLIPLIFVAIFKENLYLAFIIPSFCSIAIGTLLVHYFNQPLNFHIKHALIISALTWLWAALIGTFIMIIAVDISFINGYFENMSAWTGTGFTMFTDVESLPYSILFLRSLEQWLGGLGIVVICITIFVKSGGSALKLYLAEARDERLKPSIKNTMEKIMIIYLIITFLGIIAYLIVGVPIFDAINITFTSLATGGMTIKNASIGYYNSIPVYIITMVLMILGALSFSVHFRLIESKGKSLIQDIQFNFLILLIAIVTLIIYLASYSFPIDILFHAVSAITTTGSNIATTPEVLSWHSISIALLFLLMMIGGSSGSTAGGLKLIRVLILLKALANYIRTFLKPENAVNLVHISKKVIKDSEIKGITLFILLNFIIIIGVWFLMLVYGCNPLNALFDTISAQSGTGLTTGVINSTSPILIKIAFIIQMWMGRLETIPVLVLFGSLYEILQNKFQKKIK